MSERTDCPSVEQLKELAVGRLPDPPAAALEEHLLSCDVCAEQTTQFHHADTLVAAMRGAKSGGGGGSPEEQEQLDKLLSSLSGLRNGVVDATGQSDFDQTHIGGAGAGNDGAADLTELLSALRPAEAADELGRLGDFRLLKLIGHGGMGAVFLAEDVRLKRRVALKVLRPEYAKKKDAAERFLREAQAAATVRHDNVVTIFQVGEDNGTPFMAQELLQGESLHDRLRREGKLPIDEVIRIGRQIADGLAAAHAHGLLHRDIKPANVWFEDSRHACDEASGASLAAYDRLESGLTIQAPVQKAHHAERDGYFRVKILDFGLARLEQSDAQLTGSGMILGTPAYMSPEQADGHDMDVRTDLFSLGVVLYRMTTGEQPFYGKSTTAVLKSLATVLPAPPQQLRADVPSELSDFILRLLEKDRTRRPASAIEVSRVLASVAGSRRERFSPDEQIAQPALGESGVHSRRKLVATAMAAAVVLLGVIIVSIKTKDGNETEVTINVPGEVESVTTEVKGSPMARRGSPDPADAMTEGLPGMASASKAGDLRSDGVARSETGHNGSSPFDALDPTAIPAAERFEWQPKELVAVLGSHRQRLWAGAGAAALSGDGTWALVGGLDGKGLLLDVANGTQMASPVRSSRSVSVSPDGTMLFGNQSNGPPGLMVRDGESWTAREMGLPKSRSVTAWSVDPWDATFSLDGRWLATAILHEVLDGLPKYSTYVWDVSVNPPQRIVELHGHKHPSFSPDGKRLAVIATHDGSHTLQVFDLSELPPKRHAVVPGMEFPREYFSTVRPRHGFLASGNLAAIDKAGLLAVWDVSTNEPKPVAQRDLMKSQGTSSFEGYSLRPFRTGSEQILLVTEGGFQTWRLNNDGLELEFAWNRPEPGPDAHWVGANLTDVGISADGKTLASTHHNGMVRLWTLTENGFREKQPIRQQPILITSARRRLIVLSPDSKHFVTNSEDGFQVWRLNGTACQQLDCSDTMVQVDGPISFVSPSQFTTVGFGIAHQWQIDGDRVFSQGKLAEWLSPVAAGSDGLVMARVQDSGTDISRTELSLWQTGQVPAKRLHIWKAASPNRHLHNHISLSGGFAISQDNRVLVTTDYADDGAGDNVLPTIHLWQRSDDNSAPVQVASFTPPGGPLYQLALSPDAQRLAIANQSGVSLWLIKDNRPSQLWHRTGQSYTVAFTPDGENVATVGNGCIDNELCKIVLLSRNGELLYSRNRAITNEFDIPFPPSDLAFAPDGRHLLTANANGTVYILRLATN